MAISRTKRLLLWIVGVPSLLLASYVLIELIRGPVQPDPRSTVFEAPAAVDVESLIVPGSMHLSPLKVSLSLEEGQFDIRPAQPGEPIRVEASYDAGSFFLGHESVTDAEGRPHFSLSFGRHVSMVRGFLSARTFKLQNRVQVYLPLGVPLDLSIHVSRGQHDIDLSGLALTRLELRADSGQTNLDFHEPNPVRLTLLRQCGCLLVTGSRHSLTVNMHAVAYSGQKN